MRIQLKLVRILARIVSDYHMANDRQHPSHITCTIFVFCPAYQPKRCAVVSFSACLTANQEVRGSNLGQCRNLFWDFYSTCKP